MSDNSAYASCVSDKGVGECPHFWSGMGRGLVRTCLNGIEQRPRCMFQNVHGACLVPEFSPCVCRVQGCCGRGGGDASRSVPFPQQCAQVFQTRAWGLTRERSSCGPDVAVVILLGHVLHIDWTHSIGSNF